MGKVKVIQKTIGTLLLAALLTAFTACSQPTTQDTGSSPNSTVSSAEQSTQISTEPSEEQSPQTSTELSEEQSTQTSTEPSEEQVIGPNLSSDTASNTEESETSSVVSETVSNTEESGTSSVVSEQTSVPEGNHPSSLVGRWSLKLDTTDLESSLLQEASERMASTAIVLNADGTAVGIAGDDRINGEWGESGGYVYVTLGEATEYFQYYIDTLISMNYEGMSFVR